MMKRKQNVNLLKRVFLFVITAQEIDATKIELQMPAPKLISNRLSKRIHFQSLEIVAYWTSAPNRIHANIFTMFWTPFKVKLFLHKDR